MSEKSMSGFEKRKVAIDLMKHLATLSAAFVAVLAASIGYLSDLEVSGALIEVGVISFLVCVVTSIASILILLGNIEDLPKVHGTRTHFILRWATFIAICSFLAGIFSISFLVIQVVA